jgi:hypothetical protein
MSPVVSRDLPRRVGAAGVDPFADAEPVRGAQRRSRKL